MLTELRISNFAIIENQSIHFGAGLNVITGETGSGKSIILSALELMLGGRSSTAYIRGGCDSLEVQAHFDLTAVHPSVVSVLPDIARADELAVVRTLSRSGKGKVYINGNLGTVSLLNEIGSKLISVCSQSQQVRLLETSYHTELLDGFLGERSTILRYQSLYGEWSDKRRTLSEIERKYEEREARIIRLEETIAELSAVELTPTLRQELESAVKRLGSIQRIQELAAAAAENLDGEGGALPPLASAINSMLEMEKLDGSVSAVRELLQSARNEVQEAERELSRYVATLENDDVSFADLSERLTLLVRLERKHRTDTAGLCALLASSKKELEDLAGGESLSGLRKEVSMLESAVLEAGSRLTAARSTKANELERLVERELGELNMKDARFAVRISPADPGHRGCDRIEFLISANRGEDPKALSQIASGGELSRITLVLKKILREASGVNVLVFDEVDTGISGAVARAVGEKLKALSLDSQVLCITHLAQVASLADIHLLVSKSSGDRAVSSVRTLSERERVDEIARMLSGFEITKAARDTAKSLMKTGS